MRPANFPTVWARRVQSLMWALGEEVEGISKRWGFRGVRTIKRILEGGRPTAEFVVRLQSLEAQFQKDLQDLEAGRIKILRDGRRRKDWRKWRRIDLRDTGEHQRPRDLEALGALGVARTRIPEPPPKTVRVTLGWGNKIASYRRDESGRSPAQSGELRDPSPGVSQ